MEQRSIIELSDDEVIQFACTLMEQRCSYRTADSQAFTEPQTAQRFFVLKLGEREREVFSVAFLDNRHRLIRYEELFFGTIDCASVHPREVVKRALEVNAAAVLFAHNHPSAVAEPSDADQRITRRLINALNLVDIKVLDHIVVGGSQSVSFATRGLL